MEAREEYDWAKDCKGSFDLCIDSLRERLEKSKVVIGDCTLYNEDCRFILPTLGTVDAVVTDPPYGIKVSRSNFTHGNAGPHRDYGNHKWDDKPAPQDLMNIVLQSAPIQIIFGGNYYSFPPTSCWLVWDKLNSGEFADCELAWTNMKKAIRRVQYRWNGMIRQNREPRGDHPTQKPIGVMRWCVQKLPSDVRTILDPFAGSGTTGVAAVLEGKAFIGIEREKKYFDAMCRRIEQAQIDPEAFAKYVPVTKADA